jgi:hypothetical protein
MFKQIRHNEHHRGQAEHLDDRHLMEEKATDEKCQEN